MLKPRFVMKEIKRSKSGLAHNGIEGVVFSGQHPTQITLQLEKGKRHKFMSLKIKNKSKLLQMWFKGSRVHSKVVIKLTVSSKWFRLQSYEGYMSKGVVESSFLVKESHWGQVDGRVGLHEGPKRPLCEALKVKPRLCYKSSVLEVARAIEYLQLELHTGSRTSWKERYILHRPKLERQSYPSLWHWTWSYSYSNRVCLTMFSLT